MTRRTSDLDLDVDPSPPVHMVDTERERGAPAVDQGRVTAGDDGLQDEIVELAPLLRRVIGARVRDAQLVDDLVQEALARVMAARQRLEVQTLARYAVVVARNLVITAAQDEDRGRRHAHRLIDLGQEDLPEEAALRREESDAVAMALARLPQRDRTALLAHEVDGADMASLATSLQSTPGAVAARLNRARARLRVEYLLELERREPPTPFCRPVLFALSASDRRRQRDLDAGGHLLGCRFCAGLSEPLLDRRKAASATSEIVVPIEVDADVVTARQKGRDLARRVGFSASDLTVIATAISEIARNIVMFAERGEVTVSVVGEGDRQGVMVTVRDSGPGIADLEHALQDGSSTYGGMGMGLPGSRRLMDEFSISSEAGRGVTVTMTKWR
jgi:RNA polymerase sigma factor (sigma-70 family)